MQSKKAFSPKVFEQMTNPQGRWKFFIGGNKLPMFADAQGMFGNVNCNAALQQAAMGQ